MSVNPEAEIRKALENHLIATSVAQAGPRTDISVITGNKYSRVGGSFIDEGFQVGDQILVSGFATAGGNGYAVATTVAGTTLTVNRTLPILAAGDAVTIKAVLPLDRKFAGQEFTIPSNKPWVRATLRPAANRTVAVGTGPYIRHEGLFIVDIFHPYNGGEGLAKAERFAGAVREHFKVTTSLPRNSGLVVRVAEVQPGNIFEEPDFLMINPGIVYFADWIGT